MIIGVPKEIKEDEYRVALTPAGVMALKQNGHKVLVEQSAGMGTWITDEEYVKAGAEIVSSEEVWAKSHMIVKVKEPLAEEFPKVRQNQILFMYFHFAANEPLMRAMVKSKSICLAYETVELPDRTHPLLTPMSEVAGRISIQQGAKFLERPMGGRGILLSGVPGVKPATVVIIGAGIAGINAAKVAAGTGSQVYLLDINLDRLRYCDDIFPKNVTTLHSNPDTLSKVIQEADLVIGAVYITGAKTPILITREMLKTMKPRSVVVDISVDQGGCFETTKPTSHKNPTYVVEDIVHYSVANMPGAVANTSSYALTNATLPYIVRLADKGMVALQENEPLKKGLSIAAGEVTQKPIAEQYGYNYLNADSFLSKNLELSLHA
jgi:alanine dehydrogenase